MTEERVPCTECGVMILPATAAKNDGLCMPCSNGTRGQTEASKAARAKLDEDMHLYRQSAQYKHWCWLVDQDCGPGDGFDALSEPNRLYYAVRELSGDVFNGGFDQYFHNSAGNHYIEAVEGLQAMGATRTLELLQAARRAVFGDTEVPADRMLRYQAMHVWGEEVWEDVISPRLDALDRQFYDKAHERDISDRIERYAEEHRLREGF